MNRHKYLIFMTIVGFSIGACGKGSSDDVESFSLGLNRSKTVGDLTKEELKAICQKMQAALFSDSFNQTVCSLSGKFTEQFVQGFDEQGGTTAEQACAGQDDPSLSVCECVRNTCVAESNSQQDSCDISDEEVAALNTCGVQIGQIEDCYNAMLPLYNSFPSFTCSDEINEDLMQSMQTYSDDFEIPQACEALVNADNCIDFHLGDASDRVNGLSDAAPEQ